MAELDAAFYVLILDLQSDGHAHHRPPPDPEVLTVLCGSPLENPLPTMAIIASITGSCLVFVCIAKIQIHMSKSISDPDDREGIRQHHQRRYNKPIGSVDQAGYFMLSHAPVIVLLLVIISKDKG